MFQWPAAPKSCYPSINLSLKHCVLDIGHWMSANRLKLNAGKTELLFASTCLMAVFQISFSQWVLPWSLSCVLKENHCNKLLRFLQVKCQIPAPTLSMKLNALCSASVWTHRVLLTTTNRLPEHGTDPLTPALQHHHPITSHGECYNSVEMWSTESNPSGGTRQTAARSFMASSMLAGSRESTNRQSIVIASSWPMNCSKPYCK